MSLQSPLSRFTPGPGTGRSLRDALSRFGTGVAVVTTMTPDGPLGMTVNSFASVSLDPPLVLWSAAKTSRRYPFFAAADHMAIHIMEARQIDTARAFAAAPDAFDVAAWEESPEGTPLLGDALARFECAAHAEHDGGDHGILVGRVLRAAFRDGIPLICYGSRFGVFSPACV